MWTSGPGEYMLPELYFFCYLCVPMLRDIKIEDYDYPLPEGRIARFPLEHRDDSKLLVFTKSSGESPVSSSFKEIAGFLPSGGVMVFNETKVVPARLLFQRPTGAIIEVFCLHILLPLEGYSWKSEEMEGGYPLPVQS